MQLVFLDIDGVLRNLEALKQHWLAHPDCVAALNRLTQDSGAVIVVSSSWRGQGRGAVKDIAQRLAQMGVTGRIVGVTPRLRDAPRGREIAAWLSTHRRPVEAFVILDDDADMAELGPYLVQTDSDTGLTAADVDRALRLLQDGPVPAWPLHSPDSPPPPRAA